MIKLTIDGIKISVAEGTTVHTAAKQLGVEIPTMCYLEGAGFHNHPACMVCLVKDKSSGKLLPSCALPAVNNMNITTRDEEVMNARKEALELLMSDHVGDCDAPCRLGCPAYMNIPLMNRLIAKGNFQKAISIVKEEIALPHILGYICPAPCEKVCRRNEIDYSVQICQLKKFVAATDLQNNRIYFPKKDPASAKKVAVIGSGPAGLASAFYLLRDGHSCTIYDKNEMAGGSLRYQQMDKPLPPEVLDAEIEYLKSYGVDFKLNSYINQNVVNAFRKNGFDAIILATGANTVSNLLIDALDLSENGMNVNPDTFETSVVGVFACGSAVRTLKMAVRSVAQGKAAAHSVTTFLNGNTPEKGKRIFNSKFGKLAEEEFDEYLKEAPNRRNLTEKYTGLKSYTIENAKAEADQCMHCDCRKMNNCLLRIHSDTYQIDRRNFLLGKRNNVSKFFKQDMIVYEPEKCIKCSLCVEISARKKEEIGFTHIGRGFDVKIKAPFGKSIDEALTSTAIECANACPTGAISLIE